MDIPSGSHKYAGDPVHLKLRLVFTDPNLFKNRPGKSTAGKKSSDQHQFDQHPYQKQQHQLDQNNQKNCQNSLHVQNDARFRATYLLRRSDDLATNKWDIEEEECEEGDNSAELTSSSSSRRLGAQEKSIAAILRQTGFKLRVVNVPTSRNACSACSIGSSKTNANDRSSTLIETRFSSGDINLERGVGGSPDRVDGLSPNQHDNLAREHLVEKSKSDNFFEQSSLRQDHCDGKLIVANLFCNRQRAMSWKDTLDVTSAGDHNDYLKRMQARNLTANTRIVSDARTNKAGGVPNRPVSLLMRNHYRPHHDPCHCSHIAGCHSSNVLNDSDNATQEALSFLCSCRGSIRESAHLDQDKSKDNLNFPTTAAATATSMVASGRYFCSSTNCRCCCCRCSEFNEGYKCWLKLHNKTNGKDALQFVAPSSSKPSSSGFVQADVNAVDNDDDAEVRGVTDRLQVKVEDDNSDTFNLLLSGLGTRVGADQSGSSAIDLQNEKDAPAVNTISQEYNKINETLMEEWKKLYPRNVADDDEMSQKVTGCHCSQPHGETLFLVLEKYAPIADNLSTSMRPRDGTRLRQRSSIVEGNSDNSPSNSNKNSKSKSIDDDDNEIDSDNVVVVVVAGVGDNDEVEDKKSESRGNRKSNARRKSVEHVSPSEQEPEEWQRVNFTGPTDKPLSTLNDGDLNQDIGGASSSSLFAMVSEPKVDSAILVTHRDESNGKYNDDNDNNRDSNNKLEKNEQSDTIVECNTSIAQQAQLQRSRRRQRQQQLHTISQFAGEVDSGNKDSNSSSSMILVEQKRQGLAELECSILLAVITIDVFNMTVEMKPDLNKLIVIDLRDLVATSGCSGRARDDIMSEVDDMRVMAKNSPPTHHPHPHAIQHNLTSLFYHVESVHTEQYEWKALNEQLGIARQRLRLIQQVQKFTSYHAPTASSTRVNVKDELINGFLTPIDERVLIKLQYDVQYVYDLPADCHNVHVRHKLFVRHHDRWNFKRYHETPIKAHTANGSVQKRESSGKTMSNTLEQATVVTAAAGASGEAKKFNLLQHNVSIADGELKVDHMTHAQEFCLKSSSSSSLVSAAAAASNDFDSKAADWLGATGLSGHDERQRPISLSCRHMGDNDPMVQDIDESSPLLLLLHEGSTVTSKRNANGCFHLCCAEQIMLELSEKTKGTGGQDNSAKVVDQNAYDNDDDDDENDDVDDDDARDMAFEYGRKRHDDGKIDAKIVESQQVAATAGLGVVATNQVDRRQPADRVDFLPIDVVVIDPFSRDLARDFETSTPNAAITMTTTITNRDSVAGGGGGGGSDNDKNGNDCLPSPSGKKTIHEVGRESGRKAASRSPSHLKATSSFDCTSRRCEDLSNCNQSRRFLSDNPRHNHDDSDQICNLTLMLVFEIYSSDFYGDKLQGWSSVDVPVEIRRESLITNTNSSKTRLSRSTLSSNGATIQTDRVNLANARNKYNCTHQELPVMRPTFSAPLDRLRYYLTGRLPEMTPSIESFVSSTNRYMMQSEQNGKLVVNYEVTRQFSDVKLDAALRELVRSGSLKRISLNRE